MTDPDAVVLLREILAVQRQILATLERPRPRALTRPDLAILRKLLPAIGGALGSEPFASRDLCTTPATRVVLRDLNVKQIGRLLARAEGIPIDGHVLEPAGVEINVRLWRVLIDTCSPSEGNSRKGGDAAASYC